VQLQTFKEPGMGWGARTVEPVTSGSLVIEYIGEVIDEAEMEVRDRRFLG
jgi:SET domain-containing protein